MRRALLLLAALGAAVAFPARAGATTSELPAASAALVPLQAEMMLLVELGAWTPPLPPKLQAVHDEWVSYTAGMSRASLLAWLDGADADGLGARDRLVTEVGGPSPQVLQVLDLLGPDDRAALDRGDTVGIAPMTYEKAWFDLDERDGRGPDPTPPAGVGPSVAPTAFPPSAGTVPPTFAPWPLPTPPVPTVGPAPTAGATPTAAPTGRTADGFATTAPAGTIARAPGAAGGSTPVTPTSAGATADPTPGPTAGATAGPTAAPTAAPTTVAGATTDGRTADGSTPNGTGPATMTPVASRSTGSSTLALVAAAVGAALAALVAGLVVRARRPGRTRAAGDGGRDGERDTITESVAHELLDAGQRVTGSLDAHEVERRAVEEAVAVTHAAHGAFVVGRTLARSVAHTTTAGFPADADLERGVVARALDAGQAGRTAGSDRAVSGDRVALLAVPTVHAGVVVGALVVSRPAERPFSAAEADALGRLAPLVASALDTAARHADTAALALVDALTSAGNRRRLEQDLPRALDGAAPVGLVMVDVDHFKRFNDTFGHQAGDEALRLVAAALQANVRDGDVVYRYGGEEFCVLLPHATAADAIEVAERLRLAVVAATTLSWSTDPRRALTVSLGVALSDGPDGARLVERADHALYAAKHGGRDRVVVAD